MKVTVLARTISIVLTLSLILGMSPVNVVFAANTESLERAASETMDAVGSDDENSDPELEIELDEDEPEIDVPENPNPEIESESSIGTIDETDEDELGIEIPANPEPEIELDEQDALTRFIRNRLPESYSGNGSGTADDPYIVTSKEQFNELRGYPIARFVLQIEPPSISSGPFGMMRSFGVSEFSDGSGTASDPYLVSNAAQLSAIRNNLSAHYKLTADIDLENEEWMPIAGDPWQTGVFSGSIDGDGYVIRNLYINQPELDFVGFIGYADDATLMNITLENVSITGSWDAGGLVGASYQSTIENCAATGGEVSGTGSVGGLVGYIYSYTSATSALMRDSWASVALMGGSYVGGLVGEATVEVVIERCYATGDVLEGYYSGGLLGFFSGTSITQSYATGNVSGYDSVGGLVGHMTFESGADNSEIAISECYATGNVAGEYHVGGLIGNIRGYDYIPGLSAYIVNCFALGDVTGVVYPAALISGEHRYSWAWNIVVTNCYSASEGADELFFEYGYTVTNCYYLTDALNQKDSFEDWDFDDIWDMEDGVTMPYLRALPSPFENTTPPSSKAVSVGTQNGTLTAGAAGTVTFTIATVNIANGSYTVSVANLPTGMSVQGEVEIIDNSGTLTLLADANTVASTTNNLTLTIDGVTSAAFTLTVSALSAPDLPHVEAGSTFIVMIKGSNVSPAELSGTKSVSYDPTKVKLIDFAMQSPGLQTNVEVIASTGLNIVSVTSSEIQFTIEKEIPSGSVWSGTVTIMRFEALQSGVPVILLT